MKECFREQRDSDGEKVSVQYSSNTEYLNYKVK